MSVDRACILLLSTKTWDLSGGRKGGFQSYREPLSIFELITAVFLLLLYILSFSNKRIDLISFYWLKIGTIIQINSKLSEILKLYIYKSLGNYSIIQSSSHQFELFKSFFGSGNYLTALVGIEHDDSDPVFTFKGNGNGITQASLHQFVLFKPVIGSGNLSIASVGIKFDDLDQVFTSKGNGNGIYSILSFESVYIKLFFTFIGDPFLDGLIFLFESFDGCIILLTTLNGNITALGRCINIFIIKIYGNIIHLNNQHIKNKKYNLKQLKKLINSLKINGPAPRLDLVTIYFQMKKIKTSFNILVRIGGPYPSHMKLVTTISLLLYVLIRFECKKTQHCKYEKLNCKKLIKRLIELDLVDPNSFQMAIQFILSKIYTILSCNSGTANSAQKVVKNSTKLFIYSLINSVVKDRRHLIAIFINLKWSISNYIMCFILYRKAIISCTNIATVWLLQCKESKGIIITYKSKNCYKLFFIKILNKNKVVYKGLYNLSLELDGLQHRIDNFVSIQMTTMKNRWLCEIYKFLILCVRNIKSSFKDLFINEIMFVFCTPKKKKKK
eukprot:551508_1